MLYCELIAVLGFDEYCFQQLEKPANVGILVMVIWPELCMS